MNITLKNHLLILCLLAVVTIGIYYQGLTGPFVFDDKGNIQENAQLRISNLNTESLMSSALSGRAGPLKRPVAMLSYALNYYFAGEYHAFSFKLTNVAIQIICAWLLFVFCSQLLQQNNVINTCSCNKKTLHFVAVSIALLWVAHPINLTSVLYIVQRMTSLSTLFVLATMVLYIKARSNNKRIFSLTYLAVLVCFLLAIFSKENAILTPVYLLLIEWIFFADKSPWIKFDGLSKPRKTIIHTVCAITLICMVIYTINYASTGYGVRSFTMLERVLTESRVIVFYLSLIILPRINAFGLFHDDIQLSTSLIDPWTTLLSIILISSILLMAVRWRKTKPLVSFGLLFFFATHLLESTIFGLEIAHEHRNHLASTGIIIALAGFFVHHPLFNKKLYVASACLFFIVLSSTTMFRAYQWQNEYTLATFEAHHHPNSPAALALLSSTAFKHQDYAIAKASINKAKELDPKESSYAINSLVLAVLLNKPISQELIKEVKNKLHTNPLTASTQIAFAHISTRLGLKAFKPLQHDYIDWLNIIIDKLGDTRQASIYHYFLAKAYLATGNTLGAINAHQQAFNLDKKFINPLFEMGNIFLALKQADNARIVLAQIEDANANPDLDRHYDKHIEELRLAIKTIEKGQQ